MPASLSTEADQVEFWVQHGDPWVLSVDVDGGGVVPAGLVVTLSLLARGAAPLVTLSRVGDSFVLSEVDALALSPSRAYRLRARDVGSGRTWFTGPFRPSSEGRAAGGPVSASIVVELVDAVVRVGLTVAGGVADVDAVVAAAVATHDTSGAAHDDIRALIAAIEPGGGVGREVEQHLPLAIEFADGEFTGEDTALLPAAAENPAGLLVLWSAQADPANVDVWEHQGDGVFHRVVPSWLGADRVGTLIESQMNPLAGGASELFVVTAPNEFEVPPISEAQVQALIDATEPTDLLAADEDLGYSIAATDAWEPEQWFVHNGETTGRLSTPHPGAFDTGVLMRSVTMLTGVPVGSNRFAEILSEAHDDGGGAWDAFEWADHLNNAGSFDTAVPPLGNLPDWLDRWLDFWEHTVDENSTEEDIQLLTTAANVRPGLWISRMKTIDFATGTYRVWREVLHGGDAVTVDTGQRWRLVREVVDERFESIHSLGEDWWVGNNYPGRIAKLDAFDGFTSDDSGDVEEITPGTVLVNPDASQVDPTETTSFTDAAGNVWAMGDATIGQSLRVRLAAVEAALDT